MPAPIKSDGTSSTYYDIPVTRDILTSLIQRDKDGQCYIKTEEIIELLGNDFNHGTHFKSLVRAISIERGVGKAGNTYDYECNKMHYYIDRAKQLFHKRSRK